MHIFNGILTGTYTRPAQQCHYEWAWVSLSNLAKHSITRSVARFLCGSWACCFCLLYVRPSVRPFGVSTVPSVRPSVAELANMIHVFWKQMKRLCCKFAEVVGGVQGPKTINYGGQEVTWHSHMMPAFVTKKPFCRYFTIILSLTKHGRHIIIKINVNNILCRDNWDRRG